MIEKIHGNVEIICVKVELIHVGFDLDHRR